MNAVDIWMSVHDFVNRTLAAVEGEHDEFVRREQLDELAAGHPVRVMTGREQPASPLSIRLNQNAAELCCDRDSQLGSPATLTVATKVPKAPEPQSATGSDGRIVLTVTPNYFPAWRLPTDRDLC
jgi:hypothetical protein